MRLLDRTQACARLSVLNDKAAAELESSIAKWFAKHFVKGISVPLLKQMHGSDAYTSFETLLGASSETDLIAIVRKVDPHAVGILKGSRGGLFAHLRQLAAGQLSPAPKPQKPKPPKKQPSKAKSGGVLARARQ